VYGYGAYDVIVTNNFGSVTSTGRQSHRGQRANDYDATCPFSKPLNAGDTATFSVTATTAGIR